MKLIFSLCLLLMSQGCLIRSTNIHTENLRSVRWLEPLFLRSFESLNAEFNQPISTEPIEMTDPEEIHAALLFQLAKEKKQSNIIVDSDHFYVNNVPHNVAAFNMVRLVAAEHDIAYSFAIENKLKELHLAACSGNWKLALSMYSYYLPYRRLADENLLTEVRAAARRWAPAGIFKRWQQSCEPAWDANCNSPLKNKET